ncbi:MAG: membrane protein insertase YidC [Candidatus Zixiibacteriota bacterium]
MDKKSIAIVIVLGLLVIFWQPLMIWLGVMDPPQPRTQAPAEVDSTGQFQAPGTEVTPDEIPPDAGVSSQSSLQSVTDTAAQGLPVDTIRVETQKYVILLSTHGAGPISIKLKEYNYPWESNGLIEMLPDAVRAEPRMTFLGGQLNLSSLIFSANRRGDLDARDSEQVLVFDYERSDGATIQKTYTFYPDKYSFDLKTTIPDRRAFQIERDYRVTWRTGLNATELDEKGDYSSSFALALFPGDKLMLGEDGVFGGDWEGDTTYARESFDVTWIGKRSKYFTAIMIPRNGPGTSAEISGRKSLVRDHRGEAIQKKSLSVSMTIPITDKDGRIEDSATFYVGPLDWKRMKSYDIELENMFDIGTTPYVGWMIRLFAIPIIWLLPHMYDIFPNYGVVIILLGVLVKLITWPLSRKTVKSMAAMRELQPEIEKLKEKHKNNPQAQQRAMMKMYKEAGVNPLGGCLPLLPQMPLFIALFRVFNTTILLRGAPFMFWIDDLSRGALTWTDPYMVLVLAMVVLMFFQQKISMTDPTKKAMIYIMPLVFGFMFHSFSAGLVLYWTTFSAFSLVEQLIGNRMRERQHAQVV